MRNTKLYRLLAVLLVLTLFAAACGCDVGDEGTAGGDSGGQTDDGGDTSDGGDDGDGGDTGGDDGGDTDDGDDGGDEPVDVTQGGILAQVKARGVVNCGISPGAPAFATQDAAGVWQGFDIEFCRATAAAIFGDKEAVNFVPLTAAERFTALQVGEVDLLHRTTTWTQGRDASGDQGADFGPTTFFDGQQIAGRRSQGFSEDSTVGDLDGLNVCTNAGTTTEKNISDAVAAVGASFTLIQTETTDLAVEAFVAGQCDIFTTDGSGVAGYAATNEDNADGDWAIFPAAPISKEPLGPAYPQNDSEWGDIVNWVVYATIIADEYGITRENAQATFDEEQAKFEAGGEGLNVEVHRLLGGDGEKQTAMSLDADAFLNVISQVGNYDQIFSEQITDAVGIKREGSVNARWTEGGLMYAPPSGK